MEESPSDSARQARRQTVTRREFIKGTALAATSVALSQHLAWAPPAHAQTGSKRLKFGLNENLRTLDPRMSDTIRTDAIVDTIYDQPVGRQFAGGKMDLVPRLAASWERTDPRTLVVKLRRGITFSNGEPVNAESFKYSLDTVYQKSYGAVRSYLFPSVESVEIVDDATVRVRTIKPDRTLLASLSGLCLLPPKMAAQLGRGMSTRSAGTGPFQVEDFSPSQHLKLRANDKYWAQPKPRLDGVDFVFIPDDSTRVAALLAGDVHIVNNLPIDQVERVQRSDRHTVSERTTGRVIWVGLRQDRGPLADVRVRQAFNYAVDKEAIVKNVLRGHAQVANSILAPGYPFANPNLKPYAYDPNRAKRLLSEANYPSSFTFRLAAPIHYRPVGEAVAGYLSEVGIKVSFDVPEMGVLINEVFTKGPQSRYDAWVYGQGTLTFQEDSILRLRFHSDYNAHWMAYKNEEVDALIDAGLFTLNDTHAQLIYYKAQEKIMADAPWILLHYLNTVLGVDKRVRGFGARADEYIYLHETSMA